MKWELNETEHEYSNEELKSNFEKWLDTQIDLHNMAIDNSSIVLTRNCKESPVFRSCGVSYEKEIHLFDESPEHFKGVVGFLGLDVKCEDFDTSKDATYKKCYYFMYKGYKFFIIN